MPNIRKTVFIVIIGCLSLLILWIGEMQATASVPSAKETFPRNLESFNDAGIKSIPAILKHRIKQEPFNLVATIIFFLAIVHTFMTGRFMAISHRWEHEHRERIKRGQADRDSVHHGAELLHFLGEVEAVFGLWVIILVNAIIVFYDWQTVVNYISHKVNFTEPAFVVVIMTLAATRPILRLAETIINKIANLLGGTLTARWLTTLTIGPLLGALITEPAAMTISALVLARTFYELEPDNKFKYATLGLLFVNISVGGTLTNFAAPPVLMVAGPWEWSSLFMMIHFGWKAVLGIFISNALYYLAFRKALETLERKAGLMNLKDEIQKNYLKRSEMAAKFDKCAKTLAGEQGIIKSFNLQIQEVADEIRRRMEERFLPRLLKKGVDETMVRKAFAERFEEIKRREMRQAFPALLPPNERGRFIDPDWDKRDDPVPPWVTAVHIIFMAWTIINAHHPPLFIPGILFFLGFAQVTRPFQNRIDLKPAMLVGFFLGGLVIHGGLQAWWIEPILGNLSEIPLMIGATILTAFNDNAAITFLSTLVPSLTANLKYAVVAGAVAGGGLTIIANAPNPAGVSMLKTYFNDEVSPGLLFLGALAPTVVVWVIFMVFP